MTENKTVTILARYNFSDAEIRQIALKMAGSASEYTSTEAEFASVKADFKAKLERIELDRDTLTQKIRDGFEMRPVQAVVWYNHPTPGRKTFFAVVGNAADGSPMIASAETSIREEAMDATDFQRDLPLEEKPVEHPREMAPAVEGNVCVHGTPLDRRCEACDILTETAREIGREILNPERFPETGDSAKEVAEARSVIKESGQPIGTSIAQKLAEAAQGKRPNPVVIDFAPKDDGNKCLAKWRKAARNQGWPEPCVDLIDGLARDAAGAHSSDGEGTTKSRMLSVLQAHSISTAGQAEKDRCEECEKLASTFGTSEDGQ